MSKSLSARGPLKIDAVELFKFNIPLKEPFRTSLGLITAVSNIIIRIHSSGNYGIGEGCPIWFVTGETQGTAFTAAADFAKLMIGMNALAVTDRLRDMSGHLVHNTTTKSAFEMALLDLSAKYLGVPLYALLGGSSRPIYTDSTIGLDDPDKMARKAKEIVNAGFTTVKVKLGTSQAEDVARISAIRDTIGLKIPLRIDANQGWDCPVAIATLRELHKFRIDYCEQPCAYWDFDSLKQIRNNSPIPIMADESLVDASDAIKLVRLRACDYFNIKLAKSSGILGAMQINGIASASGIKCMLGCMLESRIGLSAGAHFVSANLNLAFADLDGCFGHADDPVQGGIKYGKGGQISIPDTPGHGADLPTSLLDKLESVSV
jgi:L-alanine-DL-glutamate epimerase-like enolase superfamily enzyme